MASRLVLDWKEDEEELKILYQSEKDHQNRTRLQALWYLRQGRTIYEVGEMIGMHHRTVQDWIAWYRKGGVAEVLSHRQGGHHTAQSYLSDKQMSELRAKAERGEIGSIWDGVHWAKEQGVEYTYWGMRHVFDRLKLKKKVPRPRNPKASVEEQEAWKKGG
jgi:transposase